MDQIQKYRYKGQGYEPYLIGSKWQVAQLNYMPELALDAITKLDVHHKTDETFLLMQGQAVLIAAEIKNDKVFFSVINMEPCTVYNIPKGCWHNIALSKDAEISITEDANTHLGDFGFYPLNNEEREELKNMIKSVWKGNC